MSSTTADGESHVRPVSPEESMAIVHHLGERLQCTENRFVNGLAFAVVLLPDELDLVRWAGTDAPRQVVLELDRRLVAAVEEANSTYLRMDLRRLDGYAESRRVTLANGDSIPVLNADNSTRKLVIVVPLSEAMDATIEFPAFGKSRPITPGEAVIFPAFMVPTFAIASERTLDALVSYAYGPAFR